MNPDHLQLTPEEKLSRLSELSCRLTIMKGQLDAHLCRAHILILKNGKEPEVHYELHKALLQLDIYREEIIRLLPPKEP